MKKEIIIQPNALAEMHRHALADFPNECVGFFYGQVNENTKHVTEYVPLENDKAGDQRRRFEVHPLAYMKAERYALEVGLDLLGIYHSHPLHPAIPSVHDLKQAVPSFSYVIASVNAQEIVDTSSWQLRHDEVENNEFEQEILTIK